MMAKIQVKSHVDVICMVIIPVLRIRFVYSGSEFFHPGSASKIVKYFNPKNCS
jgi:hypothetical protein